MEDVLVTLSKQLQVNKKHIKLYQVILPTESNITSSFSSNTAFSTKSWESLSSELVEIDSKIYMPSGGSGQDEKAGKSIMMKDLVNKANWCKGQNRLEKVVLWYRFY